MFGKQKCGELPEEIEDGFDYDKYSQRKYLYIIVGLALCVAGYFLDVFFSSSYLDAGELIRAMFCPDSVDNITRIIVWDIKMPEAMMAIIVGATLGLAGVVMQTMLNNPLADPYTLGISAGASLGAATATLLGLGATLFGAYMISASAFLFALLACGGIFIVARIKTFTSDVLVLAGIGLVFFFSAIMSFLEYTAPAEALKNIMFWTMGSLAGSTWYENLATLIILLVVFMYVFRHCWDLTAMRLGDSRADSLGVDTQRMRKLLFVFISLMVAVAVSFVGCIGFVGIIGPHISRMLLGEDQRYLIPMSCISGAVILLFADMACKMIIEGALVPIGILTSMIGIPFFFYLLLRKRRTVVE